MTKDEDPIVGAGGANKDQVWDKGDDDSPLPDPKRDDDGRPQSGDRPDKGDD